MLQAIVIDTDLVVEMLSLESEHCRRGSQIITLLLSGIEATYNNTQGHLEQAATGLGDVHFCIAKISRQVKRIHQQLRV